MSLMRLVIAATVGHVGHAGPCAAMCLPRLAAFCPSPCCSCPQSSSGCCLLRVGPGVISSACSSAVPLLQVTGQGTERIRKLAQGPSASVGDPNCCRAHQRACAARCQGAVPVLRHSDPLVEWVRQPGRNLPPVSRDPEDSFAPRSTIPEPPLMAQVCGTPPWAEQPPAAAPFPTKLWAHTRAWDLLLCNFRCHWACVCYWVVLKS